MPVNDGAPSVGGGGADVMRGHGAKGVAVFGVSTAVLDVTGLGGRLMVGGVTGVAPGGMEEAASETSMVNFWPIWQ